MEDAIVWLEDGLHCVVVGWMKMLKIGVVGPADVAEEVEKAKEVTAYAG